MIVIFASRHDAKAVSLLTRWSSVDAGLLTCDDLSVAGWRHYLGTPEEEDDSIAVVGGRRVAVREIEGVLIRWPGVFEQELQHIAEADRRYVAVEMTAFMVSWFSNLRCRVVNRPTPVNLAGPHWRLEQWTHAAAQLGIPVRPAHRHVALGSNGPAPDPPPHQATVTVVGERCFGTVDEELSGHARRLAAAAGVSLLGASFSGREAGSFFTGADLLPDISSDEIADCVLHLLTGDGGESAPTRPGLCR